MPQTTTPPPTKPTRPSMTACVAAASWTDAVQAAAAHLSGYVGPVVAIARPQGDTVSITPVGTPIGDDLQEPLGRVAAAVFASPEGWAYDGAVYAARAVSSDTPEALLGVVTQKAVMQKGDPTGQLLAVSAALSAATTRQQLADHVQEAETAGQVVDLTDRLQTSADADELVTRLAGSSRELLRAHWVAVGRRVGDRFDVATIEPSDTPLTDDERTILGDALDEVAVLGEAVAWPPTGMLDRPSRRAFEKAAALRGATTAWAIPLADNRGRVETILFAWSPETTESIERVVAYWTPTVGQTVATIRDARAGWWDRLKSLMSDMISGRVLKVVNVVALTAAVVLAIPVTYRPKCECRLEPSLRRFVAAPFDATLKDVSVEPGDMVAAGDVLATLDEREIDWELAGIEAELAQAVKRRDAALAVSNLSEAQLAEFDQDRLAAQRDLLVSRRQRLQLAAPIDGMLVEGDLSRAEGMPLETGQSLFEVAPLETFLCEVLVPEFDHADVRVGQTVAISLDARLGQTLTGTVRRVRPKADVWDAEVGFVAEVEITNADGSLRPGMTGQARVTTDRHPLIRNLMHRAWGQWRRGW